jgi:fatty acid hydroxylase domain-containing protein 2
MLLIAMDSLQSYWEAVHDQFTPEQLVSVVPLTLLLATYWAVGLLHLALDYSKVPSFLYKYKIQKAERAALKPDMVVMLFKSVLFSQAFIFLPMSLMMGYFYDKDNTFGITVSRVLPEAVEVVKHFGVFLFFEEVMFFYAHWALHQPIFYSRIHKIHHQFTAPIALASIYAHPIEVIVGNIIPMITGPIVCKTHVVTYMLWAVIGIAGTSVHHCGYRFPWTLPFDHQPEFHDYHHEYFNRGNYGLLGKLASAL